jgi:uncharacterized RmlC-like cupin family protein
LSERVVLSPDDGERLWFLGNLATIKADRDATGSWAMVEMTAPGGYQTPLHVHEQEDEVFYVLEGELTISIGEERFDAPAGAFVLSPAGVPHMIQTRSRTRWLHIASRGKFIDLIRDIGVPAPSSTVPSTEGPPDFGALRQRAARHGIVILDEEQPA